MRSDYAVELYLDLKYVAKSNRDGEKKHTQQEKERAETVIAKAKK